jgi:5-formyltetrahydrofolate cyclo-ligase
MGQPVDVDQMEPVDLVVCGSVAVNHEGARVGKGGGFSDLEVALLADSGLLREGVPLVTTIHQLQLLHQDLPETEHDFRVDWIATPDEISRAPGRNREPSTIRWEQLTKGKVASIPVLARLAAQLHKSELLV